MVKGPDFTLRQLTDVKKNTNYISQDAGNEGKKEKSEKSKITMKLCRRLKKKRIVAWSNIVFRRDSEITQDHPSAIGVTVCTAAPRHDHNRLQMTER